VKKDAGSTMGKRTHKKTAKMMLGKARIRDDPLVKLEIRLVEG
jgi:hypothetical protein